MQVPADMCVHLVGVICYHIPKVQNCVYSTHLLLNFVDVCDLINIEKWFIFWLSEIRHLFTFSLVFTSDGTIHVSADRRSPCICGSQFYGLVAQNGPHGVGKCARGGKSFNL